MTCGGGGEGGDKDTLAIAAAAARRRPGGWYLHWPLWTGWLVVRTHTRIRKRKRGQTSSTTSRTCGGREPPQFLAHSQERLDCRDRERRRFLLPSTGARELSYPPYRCPPPATRLILLNDEEPPLERFECCRLRY